MGYIIAQIIGAVIAAAIILAIAKGLARRLRREHCRPRREWIWCSFPSGFSLGACFLAEIVLTMFLVLTVLGSTDVLAPVGFAGIPIGLVLTLIHLVGIPITNTSVNPARSIGPALFVGGWAIGKFGCSSSLR